MDRRKFVGAAGLAGAAGLLAACGNQPGSQASPEATCNGESTGETFEWKMVTSWPPNFPGLGTGANRLAESITRASNGRLKTTTNWLRVEVWNQLRFQLLNPVLEF